LGISFGFEVLVGVVALAFGRRGAIGTALLLADGPILSKKYGTKHKTISYAPH